MADKFHSDTQEKIEALTYAPGIQDSGDLEAGTQTITATTEASGVGNADYSTALTLASPSDARLTVARIAARLAVTIDSFDTATILYCRVYVDAQDADHRLLDESWNSTGAKLATVDTLVGTKETIFDLLRDGAAHTFYFFFWVDQAVNAVISVVELWEAVGSSSTAWQSAVCLQLNHTGWVSWNYQRDLVGSGTPTAVLSYGVGGTVSKLITWGTNSYQIDRQNVLSLNLLSLAVFGTVATDLNYLRDLYLVLRSEQ